MSFKPERCAPRRDTSRVKADRSAIDDAMLERQNMPVPPRSPLVAGAAVPVALKGYLVAVRQLQQLPAFIMYAVPRFRALRRRIPDPNARYMAVCDEWTTVVAPRDHLGAMGDFRAFPNARAAVMRLARP